MTLASTAIILAAGRGSRLGALTDERPKCLVPLAGQPLLYWQIRALREAGIERIVVVCGYRSELLSGFSVETRLNADWERTNMVSSLLCARDVIGPAVIVSYSDIVYEADVVRRLRAAPGHLAITYDVQWLDLWSRRFVDPLSDAETFQLDAEGRVAEIGSRTSTIDEIQGQYMGLLKLDGTALQWIEAVAGEEPNGGAKLDVTGLLRRLIARQHPVEAVQVKGGWCEVDSPQDLQVAQDWVSTGRLQLPETARQ